VLSDQTGLVLGQPKPNLLLGFNRANGKYSMQLINAEIDEWGLI